MFESMEESGPSQVTSATPFKIGVQISKKYQHLTVQERAVVMVLERLPENEIGRPAPSPGSSHG